MLFSQRKGLKPVKSVLQVDSIDEDLRNGLWNAVDICYWKRVDNSHGTYIPSYPDMNQLLLIVWHNFFKEPIDTIDNHWPNTRGEIRNRFFKYQWFEVYDFVEFIANNYMGRDVNKVFMDFCNTVLEGELSGYRFVGGIITPITSEQEIEAVEDAMASPDPFKPVTIHIKTALESFSDRKSPDYRNSIKESISAVESACKIITGDPKATLGDAIKKIGGLHGALQGAFEKLYGYTSDADGIRHALSDESSLDFEDAKFMLVSCSAFVNYLISKSAKKKK